MTGTEANERRAAKVAFALTAILAALLVLASVEAFALTVRVEFDPGEGRSGSQVVRQAMGGGLLLLAPLKAELLPRN